MPDRTKRARGSFPFICVATHIIELDVNGTPVVTPISSHAVPITGEVAALFWVRVNIVAALDALGGGTGAVARIKCIFAYPVGGPVTHTLDISTLPPATDPEVECVVPSLTVWPDDQEITFDVELWRLADNTLISDPHTDIKLVRRAPPS